MFASYLLKAIGESLAHCDAALALQEEKNRHLEERRVVLTQMQHRQPRRVEVDLPL